MGFIRNCLMLIGLLGLAMVTSCVVGVSSCSRVVDPRNFTRTIPEEQDKTRRMLREFLEGATYESADARSVKDVPVDVKVQDYSDGTTHLLADRKGERMMEIVVRTLKVENPDVAETKVEVSSDATGLARQLQLSRPAVVHREIRNRIDDALDAIGDHRPLPRGFTLSAVIKASKKAARW